MHTEEVVERFATASVGFAARLAAITPSQWTASTPCTEWDVRQLANHVVQANLNYVRLLGGASAAEFMRMRDLDALGSDPIDAFARSTKECTDAFTAAGALDRMLDHPAGRMLGRQGLALRATDTAIHTWDLARAIGGDERLDSSLIAWIDQNLAEIFPSLPVMATPAPTTRRFFAPPVGEPPADAQGRVLHLTGRTP
jgi:uncharacterized protein (TIGR03086 family)